MKTILLMNRNFFRSAAFLFLDFVFTIFAFLAQVKAVSVTDTFYGTGAGNNSTTGAYDSAFGWSALQSETSGGYNTAIGAAALFLNTTGIYNTASGYDALFVNT